MGKKMLLLATARTALAFAALPAAASAGTPETHCPGGAASCNIEFTGGMAELTETNVNNTKVICSSSTGSGVMGTSGGTITLTFHGCTEVLLHFKCSSAGQAEGTVKLTTLPYDNIYTTDNKSSPGFLITPTLGTSHYGSSGCWKGGSLSGNGLIVSLTGVGCGESRFSLTLASAQSSKGHPVHKQVTGTGVIYDLTSGGNTSSFDALVGFKATGGGSISLTCP